MVEYSNLHPKLAEVSIVDGIRYVDMHIESVLKDGLFEYYTVRILYSDFNYSGIVDSLIQYKYPIDKMQAVINNYLLDPEDAYAIDEFNKMQAWRKEAKEIAKQALEYELH